MTISHLFIYLYCWNETHKTDATRRQRLFPTMTMSWGPTAGPPHPGARRLYWPPISRHRDRETAGIETAGTETAGIETAGIDSSAPSPRCPCLHLGYVTDKQNHHLISLMHRNRKKYINIYIFQPSMKEIVQMFILYSIQVPHFGFVFVSFFLLLFVCCWVVSSGFNFVHV